MAAPRSRPWSSSYVWILIPLLLLLSNGAAASAPTSQARLAGRFDSIYQFGDGFADTGNMMIRDPSYGTGCTYEPYGTTISDQPTGRCSDGLLIIDYLARSFNLPSPAPYWGLNSADFTHGVNFAVDGATAIDYSADKWRSSLSYQLQYLRSYLNSMCSSPSDCKKKLERALFVVGEIGANDYQRVLESDYGPPISMQDVHNMIPEVVQSVLDAAKEVISHGAANVIVPGIYPLGCVPRYHKYYGSHKVTLYDSLGCVEAVNDISRVHNQQLQEGLKQLQEEHPDVGVHYGDYYSAFTWLLHNAASLGFDKDAASKQCCSAPGGRPCGFSHTVLCPDPKKQISWDGVHLTQVAYRNMAAWLLSDIFSPASTSTSASPSTLLLTSASPSPSPSPSHSGADTISMVLLQAVLISTLSFWTIRRKLF